MMSTKNLVVRRELIDFVDHRQLSRTVSKYDGYPLFGIIVGAGAQREVMENEISVSTG
jgi:hypothetical protein